tara:strand:- start:19827 stop:20669 length:843 start_codon:yes stop_codon:yes gene_type:complete
MTDHILAAPSQAKLPQLILAPAIGAGLAQRFMDAGFSYLDARGNCHINLGAFFVHIEGRTGPTQVAHSMDRGIRRAGYQVLFAYLAKPELLNETIREVAAVSGVSRQPVSTLRRRLVDDGYVFTTKSGTRWYPRRFSDAINLWLQGYKATLRPALLVGRFRTRERNPGLLEELLVNALGDEAFQWGGAAAANRMSPHFRGQRTVLHVSSKAEERVRGIEMMPDRKGNLELLRAFGDFSGPKPELVPPLLAYAELLQDDSERARESAQILFEKFIELEAHE